MQIVVPANKAKFSEKLNFFVHGNFTLFISKSFQILSHFFALLFPKDSKNLKFLNCGLWEVGTKRRLNGVNKWRGKKSVKNFFCCGNFTPIMSNFFSNLWTLLYITFPQGFWKSKNFGQIWDHFVPILFHKDCEPLQFLGSVCKKDV